VILDAEIVPSPTRCLPAPAYTNEPPGRIFVTGRWRNRQVEFCGHPAAGSTAALRRT